MLKTLGAIILLAADGINAGCISWALVSGNLAIAALGIILSMIPAKISYDYITDEWST